MEFNGITEALDTAKTYVLGRDPHADIPCQEAFISWRHAQIHWDGKTWVLQDLDSTNGTYAQGRRITLATIADGAVFTVGDAADGVQLRFAYAAEDCGDANEASSLIARQLTVKVKCGRGPRRLLDRVSFEAPPKSMTAVIGPSGSGKSVLLRALTGHQRHAKGKVRYEGQNLPGCFAQLRHQIGIVPQQDVLHPQLTVRTALRHTATLRFPRETDAAERDRRVDEVLSDLKLDLHADQTVTTLSGGQRKRVSVAQELLTRPSLLLLDEPTSGLDAGMDRDVMRLLRGLADGGRTVLVVTHSVRELELCDKVLVLAPGGSVAYFGPPEEALEFLGQETWADVFSAFEAHSGHDWAGRWRESPQYMALAAALRTPDTQVSTARQIAAPPKPPRWTTQLSTLVSRYLAVLASDRGFIGLMTLLPLVLGLANTLIPADFGLRKPPDGTSNVEAGTIIASLAISMCFVGATNSVRELVKERAIYERERAAGLSRSAYLASKIVVLGLITGAQGIVLCAISLAPRDLPSEGVVIKGTPAVEMTLVIMLLGFTSMMCGLVTSSLVKTAERTMPLLALFSVAQYMFSGIAFRLADSPGVEQAAWLAPSRWAVAALGATLDLEQVLRPQDGTTRPLATDPLWQHTLGQWLIDTGVLLATALICYLLTIQLLRRLEPEPVRAVQATPKCRPR
ncbi:ATP-binding cassette domain-containing protein [Streptomyces sp. NPDC001928]|uniref:ATP-binding cassette domain-containing protein n=1 Tax=Streptomyces sp. NPDC001928 TaxID=3154404 RepID=UPI0033258045